MDAPKYIVIEDSSRNTSSCPSTQLISVLVITAEVDLMDQLLVGQSMCHKEVEKKDECPQHDPLAERKHHFNKDNMNKRTDLKLVCELQPVQLKYQ